MANIRLASSLPEQALSPRQRKPAGQVR